MKLYNYSKEYEGVCGVHLYHKSIEKILYYIVAPNRTIQNISRQLKFSQLYIILKISSYCCTVASLLLNSMHVL